MFLTFLPAGKDETFCIIWIGPCCAPFAHGAIHGTGFAPVVEGFGLAVVVGARVVEMLGVAVVVAGVFVIVAGVFVVVAGVCVVVAGVFVVVTPVADGVKVLCLGGVAVVAAGVVLSDCNDAGLPSGESGVFLCFRFFLRLVVVVTVFV